MPKFGFNVWVILRNQIKMTPIQLLQKQLNLVPDGIIGEKTFQKLSLKWNLNNYQLAHFLGQCEHETGGFTIWEENLNYSSEGLLKVFPKYYKDSLLAVKHQRKPKMIANHVYGNRMGNNQPDDGWLYRGRGAIQLTGRTNYRLFAEYVNDPSIMDFPNHVSMKYVFDSALWFFTENNLFRFCNGISDESILKLSKAINLGNPNSSIMPHGFQDRRSKTLKYASLF